MARKLLGFLLVATVAVTASTASGDPPSPAKAAPVESRTFHFKAGTNIELPPGDCDSNIDWLLVRGTGIADSKIDVSPKVSQVSWNTAFPASNCTGPDCIPVYIKITGRDAPGPRKVTAKTKDGRVLETTFDVVANAGRCDYPKKH